MGTGPTPSDRPPTNADVACPADGLPPDLEDEPLESVHAAIMTYLLAALRWLLRDDACVEMELPVQWDPSNLRRHVMPDVFVSLGVPARPGQRRSYATWVEGKGPDLVFEVASESTVDRDLGEKLARYRDDLAVREYVLFDPRGEHFEPRLRLFRRRDDALVELERPDPDAPLALETIAADVALHGEELRLIDRGTGETIDDYAGQARARRELEQHLQEREKHLQEREKRIRQLEDELRRLRGGQDG